MVHVYNKSESSRGGRNRGNYYLGGRLSSSLRLLEGNRARVASVWKTSCHSSGVLLEEKFWWTVGSALRLWRVCCPDTSEWRCLQVWVGMRREIGPGGTVPKNAHCSRGCGHRWACEGAVGKVGPRVEPKGLQDAQWIRRLLPTQMIRVQLSGPIWWKQRNNC